MGRSIPLLSIAASLAEGTEVLDIEQVAKDAGSVRSANVVLLGMAAKFLEIVSPEALRDAVATIFSKKGEQIVESNLKAFDMGANVH